VSSSAPGKLDPIQAATALTQGAERRELRLIPDSHTAGSTAPEKGKAIIQKDSEPIEPSVRKARRDSGVLTDQDIRGSPLAMKLLTGQATLQEVQRLSGEERQRIWLAVPYWSSSHLVHLLCKKVQQATQKNDKSPSICIRVLCDIDEPACNLAELRSFSARRIARESH
jgi:hypothetical protein